MPRNPGTGQYSKPIPDAVPNTTIASAPYNTNVDDVVIDLNQPRPVVAGGTGAVNAHDARINLGTEMSASVQQVANFDSHVFESGSFFAGPAALASPIAARGFVGQAVIFSNDPNYITIWAHDLSDSVNVPGRTYVREKKAGIWGPWAIDGSSAYVPLVGGSMTGQLVITAVEPQLILSKSTPTGRALLWGENGPTPRWAISLGDEGVEAGANTGSNFQIYRFDDAGAYNGSPMTIQRNSSEIQFNSDVTIAQAPSLSGHARLRLNCLAGTTTGITYKDAGIVRWEINVEAAASGGNFIVSRHNDAGAEVDQPFRISRATGGALFTAGVGFAGAGSNDVPGFGNTNVGATIAQNNGSYIAVSRNVGSAGFFNLNIDGGVVLWQRSGNSVGSVNVNSTSTAYTTSSSADLKEDLKTFDAAAIIDATQVWDFKWKSSQERAFGVLAQQAIEVYPTAVVHHKETDWYGVDYSRYVPVLLQELKALRARVAQLESGMASKPA